MAKDAEGSTWPSLINAVKTPLGFFTLLALILDSALLAAAAATSRLPLWAPFALLGFLIVCVFTIVLRKPEALYHPRDWPTKARPVTVTLVFPVEPIDVDLDVEQCKFEVRNLMGNLKHSGRPNLTFGHGGWNFQLLEGIEPTDSVRLELVERNMQRWRTNPFAPYATEAKVILLV